MSPVTKDLEPYLPYDLTFLMTGLEFNPTAPTENTAAETFSYGAPRPSILIITSYNLILTNKSLVSQCARSYQKYGLAT